MANLSPAQQQQLSQQLQTLNLYTPSANQSASQATYPHSPASLSSLYSSVSSPPPSYAASSSSGRQSPTPTVSSSSEYSSIPPPPHLRQSLLSSASSTSSTSTSKRTPQTSPCPGGAIATVVSSVIRPSHIQAWGARQAKSQSPVIMQSVKSTQVQKPILQTAIAPTAPQITSVPAAFVTTNASCSSVKMTASQQTLQASNQNATALSYTGHQVSSVVQQTKLFSPPTSNPPPYPSGSQRLANCVSQPNSCYAQNHGVIPPPPPYASAVQQQKQCIANRNNFEDSVITPHPPPPPPPPYSAALTTIHESDPIYPVMNSRQAGTGNNTVQIPTTDPPSYASSVAALAVHKAVSPVTSSGMLTTTNGCVKLPNAHQIPGRPPPPLPPNSDLVNTVESICASQVHPPLPSKPCSLQPFNDTASVTSATESDCSSNSTSTCNVYPAPVAGQRRPAPPPPPSSPPPPCVEASSATKNSEKCETGNYKTTHHSPIPVRKPLSKEKERERRETKVKNYSPAAFKFYMEQHVENIIKSQKERETRRQQLEAEMSKEGLTEEDKRQMRRMLHQKESNYIRLKRAKMDKSMFCKIQAIGVGAFGEVALVRKKGTNQLYAMKTLKKDDVLKRNQVAHVKAERDILAEADNEWVVKLYYSFQDTDNLYFVMEYIPGGDLMSLLIKLGIFQESLARFYIAELVIAVQSVHKMGFIHRDIKPDNILIDSDGHIKLTDFGLCTGFRWTHNSKYYQRNNGVDHSRQDSMDVEDWSNHCHCIPQSSKPLERRRRREHQRCQAHSLVGTPNYIAPEVLMRTGYAQSCDWWSVGVILYEMIVGQPPFLANTPEETQHKVIHWKSSLKIPKEAGLSPSAIDLILKLCCGPEERLGRNGAEEIKAHPFFESIDFDGGLRKQAAPFIPPIRHPTDTSNFDPIDPERLHNSKTNGAHPYDDNQNSDRYENGKHPEHAFFEFTFRRFFDDGGQPYPLRLSLDGGDASNSSSVADNGQGAPVYV
ncbi:serine/threonine-protein kinase LATS1-like protein [Leptotrombidium deliense]|uniref:non-specific serine/threonine protein kinase n=1 Tax=Leptotrombidium deliense TaxID=299467 RepID=A0A443SVB6_9ACAR|nr:serine/threonine-protein kinase LATS1-like protein [Leptotrombidium deliense]